MGIIFNKCNEKNKMAKETEHFQQLFADRALSVFFVFFKYESK